MRLSFFCRGKQSFIGCLVIHTNDKRDISLVLGANRLDHYINDVLIYLALVERATGFANAECYACVIERQTIKLHYFVSGGTGYGIIPCAFSIPHGVILSRVSNESVKQDACTLGA